jgi:disulfide bond formation protein DsbB
LNPTADAAAGPPVTRPAAASPLLWLTLVLAVLTVAGSLALSLMDQKKACALCFYQRTFALSLVALLGVGLVTRALRGPALAVLALPLALGGLGVAAFHVYLEVNGTLECPPGLYGVLTAPKQSLAAFALLSVLLTLEAVRGLSLRAVGMPGLLLALVLGGGLVWASISANPPPPKPTAAYKDSVPDTCRIPYREPAQSQ